MHMAPSIPHWRQLQTHSRVKTVYWDPLAAQQLGKGSTARRQAHRQQVLSCPAAYTRNALGGGHTCQVASTRAPTAISNARFSSDVTTDAEAGAHDLISSSIQNATTARSRRRSRRSLDVKSDTDDNVSLVPAARVKQQRTSHAVTASELHQSTGLSLDLCQHVLSAQQQYKEVPKNAVRLQDRIEQLIRLLGADRAAAAIRSSPLILSRRCVPHWVLCCCSNNPLLLIPQHAPAAAHHTVALLIVHHVLHTQLTWLLACASQPWLTISPHVYSVAGLRWWHCACKSG